MIHKDLQGNLWDCQIKEALKDIPIIKSDLPISAYGSIDLDELNKTVERLNKIPNYDDLMKENNKLQSNWNKLKEMMKADGDDYVISYAEIMDKMEKGEEYEDY